MLQNLNLIAEKAKCNGAQSPITFRQKISINRVLKNTLWFLKFKLYKTLRVQKISFRVLKA